MRGAAGCSRVSNSIMNRIMLRFRPIAPKPNSDSSSADLDKTVKNGKRTKRKYVRVRGRQRKTTGRSDGVVTTLQLLPADRIISESQTDHPHDQLTNYKVDAHAHHDHIPTSVTKTWITLECITEIYTGLGFGGVSDRDKINNLEMDTCPGFISDGSNNVVWVNQAYRKLVQGDHEEKKNIMACLVVKHKLPYLAPSFACRVRMIQQTSHGHNWNRIVPCDVSRMDFPGFAWKLDVNTALGLAI